MRVLYYDCFCGISGDMNLGALIDLGVDKNYIIKELLKLNFSSEYEIEVKKGIKKGITGTKVDVILKNQQDHHNNIEETHHHGHTHGEALVHNHSEDAAYSNQKLEEHHHHNHEDKIDPDGEAALSYNHADNLEHNHGETDHKSHHHQHRNLKDIENIIKGSTLNENVKEMSLHMFIKVAEAEALVHGKSLQEVHFHEVGATDSIVDIVGAAIALDYLKVDKIMASTVQVGGGFVKCAHGVMPVPAPATVNILKHIPMKTGIVPFETTTPTGAAILAANVKEFTDNMDFVIEKTGYGLGTRELDIPNVLRVYLGNLKGKDEDIEEQYLLETNIDDMNPELYEYVEGKLFNSGALDVFKTPIIMKKGRPAIKLSVLVSQKRENQVLDVVFKETTSIGIRKFKVEKTMLNREFSKLKTRYGEVTIKNSYYEGKLVKYKAEYEDCKRLAEENNVPIREIYRSIDKVIDEG